MCIAVLSLVILFCASVAVAQCVVMITVYRCSSTGLS